MKNDYLIFSNMRQPTEEECVAYQQMIKKEK